MPGEPSVGESHKEFAQHAKEEEAHLDLFIESTTHSSRQAEHESGGSAQPLNS